MTPRHPIVAPITSPRSHRRMALRLSGEDLPQVSVKIFDEPLTWEYACTSSSMTLSGREIHDLRVPVKVLVMPKGQSFTGESTIEIHYSANQSVTYLMLEKLYRLGIHPAEPGEFSMRAFMNERLSLTQTQSIAALIASSSAEERTNALKFLSGSESEFFEEFHQTLKDFRQHLEALIDFPEEPDVLAQQRKWHTFIESCEAVIAKRDQQAGEEHQVYPKVVILGETNVGKSSLIKALIPESHPIISHEAGTTLDLVPYPLEGDRSKMILYDSPGLKDIENQLDELSLKELKEKIGSFDGILLLHVSGKKTISPPWLPLNTPLINVATKCDLYSESVQSPGDVNISSLHGQGIHELRTLIFNRFKRSGKDKVRMSAMQQRLLDMLNTRLPTLKELLLEEVPREELAAYEIDELLDEARAFLHEPKNQDEILDQVFRDFCIGK